MRQTLKKYLRNSSDIHPLESHFPSERRCCCSTRFAVVIPAFAESRSLPATLESLSASFTAAPEELLRSSRIIVVVNTPSHGSSDDPALFAKIADNQALLSKLRNPRHSSDGFDFFDEMDKLPLLEWIDAASPGREIKPKHGVGMARRIGIDAVLPFLDWDADPVICSLDADAIVETNYVAEIAEWFRTHPEFPGASVAIEHQRGSTQERECAIRCYEEYLRSYVSGLKRAGSPYAYNFIGSAMVFRANAYVKAGGMPAKSAGEDFYFMQALRKTVSRSGFQIGYIDKTIVYPSPRSSDRVPFGTGRRVDALLAANDATSNNVLPGCRPYLPEEFDALAAVLSAARSILIQEEAGKFLSALPGDSVAFFDARGFRGIWPEIVRNTPKSPEKLEWAFHTWFDALRTLQFIHEGRRR
ncbi:MAG: hypothetical protein KAG97_02595 [Victivallales bacterium]|nr:hypothetical protein [Victivallales bacterium]